MQFFIHVDNESYDIALNQIVASQNARGKFTTVSGNTPQTVAAAALSGADKAFINLTATLAGAGSLTLPTVAVLLAADPSWVVGESREVRIINSSSGAFAWTVLTATGWTLAGTMSIAQNTWRDFLVTCTAAGAMTFQAVGTGTQS